MQKQKHIPVLSQEVLELLNPQSGERYLDLTAGYGGHAGMIGDRIGDNGFMTLVDRDIEAVRELRKIFAGKKNIEILHQDFLAASEQLLASNRQYDIVFADLGVSSPHLNNANRGFSFSKEGPLDMRMDVRQDLTAEIIINTYEKAELARLLRDYGEIRNAGKVAARLIEQRPYKTTTELAKKITQIMPGNQRIHPATKVFQALRIAVNDELGLLRKALNIWVELLDNGGRIGVISFHSLEDRLVKQVFKDYGGNRYDAKLQTVTKGVVTSSDKEVVFNPRARSAKLRVAQRK